MADYSIIADVSNSILKMLRENICPEPLQSPESIQLSGPTDKNGDFQLGIYLYDIKEMSEYRSSAPIRGTNNVKTFPPKPLTLHYMLFLNSKAQIAAGAEAEQRIIGRSIQVLTDIPYIDVTAAHPFLEDSEENASVTFLNLNFEDKSKIWSSLSIPYQVGVYFTVSPVLLSSRRSEQFSRVTNLKFQVGQNPQKG